ncbi:MAG: mannose-1-phosphate guanylyltransferase [Lachnospiraceae bacterium]|nr:mannose-1-phosphate guanylyltransferase [Lachnospiraceae bacterium]
MKKTVLIMAGGRGERFWPRSRKKLPKQFLALAGNEKTMIQLTVERILALVNIEDIFISTNRECYALVEKQLPDIPKENIICEPFARNTAPCIGLGAMHILDKYEDAIMIVLPSDHLIRYNSIFINALNSACEIAGENTNLVTLGITPSYPETGYGYIKFNADRSYKNAFAVEEIVEKPDIKKAKAYLATEQYLWNSGMFVWKVSSIIKNIEAFLPDTYRGLERIKASFREHDEGQVLEKEFYAFHSESVDYGIMEKASDVYTIPGNFGWDDVGSWLAIERIRTTNELGNIVSGNVITVDSKKCTIEGQGKLIAAVGLRDIIIVDTEDAILICAKDSSNDVKKVIENLKICNRNEYI